MLFVLVQSNALSSIRASEPHPTCLLLPHFQSGISIGSILPENFSGSTSGLIGGSARSPSIAM